MTSRREETITVHWPPRVWHLVVVVLLFVNVLSCSMIGAASWRLHMDAMIIEANQIEILEKVGLTAQGERERDEALESRMAAVSTRLASIDAQQLINIQRMTVLEKMVSPRK